MKALGINSSTQTLRRHFSLLKKLCHICKRESQLKKITIPILKAQLIYSTTKKELVNSDHKLNCGIFSIPSKNIILLNAYKTRL